VLLRAVDRFGCGFTQLYGLTETIGGGAMLSFADHDPARGKLRACGVAWGDYALRIVTPAEKSPARARWARSRSAPRRDEGLLEPPEATAEAIDAEGWSARRRRFLRRGGLSLHPRRVKDMIVTGGENVYPAEVENALFSHPTSPTRR